MSSETNLLKSRIIGELNYQMLSVEEYIWYIDEDIQRIKNGEILPMDRSLDFHLGMKMAYEKVFEDIRYRLLHFQDDSLETDIQGDDLRSYRVRYESGVAEFYSTSHIADVLLWTTEGLAYGAGNVYVDEFDAISGEYFTIYVSYFVGVRRSSEETCLADYGEYGYHTDYQTVDRSS